MLRVELENDEKYETSHDNYCLFKTDNKERNVSNEKKSI